ncbi:MAG: HAD-IIIA family hydrolase, partial [Gammaproteobacteria bacterium]
MARARAVELVVFDVDGVLTDGGLLLDERGQEHKIFHSRDGHGMKMLQRAGVRIAVISGRVSGAVTHRMAGLGVRHVHQGCEDKLPAYEALLEELGLGPGQTAYVGDDVVDLPVMRRAGLAVAVADAHPLVRARAHWCTTAPGGRGAAREVCELVLEAKGRLEAALAPY